MNIQKTEWGHIEYFHIPEKNSNQSINIGFMTIEPGKRQPHHVHYGQEQFIYIIEGQGIYIVNGVRREYRAGMCMYIEPDATHETLNIGSDILREIVISNTVSYGNTIEVKDKNYEEECSVNVIYEAVETIRTQVLDTLHLPFAIFGTDWTIAWSSEKYPAYCIDNCGQEDGGKSKWSCLKQDAEVRQEEGIGQFKCPYGLTVFHLPIIHHNSIVGTIRGGHILLSDAACIADERTDIYDTPKSAVIGIQKVLTQISKSIENICQFNDSRQELMRKDQQIQLSEQRFYKVNDQVTNLKINHHFLFNTLNSMAKMALGNEILYDAIVNLAKMFRYTMTVDLRFVSLSSELEYLGTYLELQKLRFGSSLRISHNIQGDLKEIQVPFNFLQPIVENAFTHGFADINGKRQIEISAIEKNNKAYICVYNNGSIVDQVTLNRVNKIMSTNNGHGLSFIYEKLDSAYLGDFTMELLSSDRDGTCVRVIIPVSRQTDIYGGKTND